ncbi:MAG: hypothetical protein MSH33_10605 [Fusobacterium necrophorum]|nr:hypothetical protein [Fusobacterium necrophorum]
MDIVDIYKECGDFHEAVRRSGLRPLQAHIKLMKKGVLKIQDKIKYGTKACALGGKAEELFQKLVPEAVDANKYWKKNNPVYDFMYKGLTIDIKYSSCVDVGVKKKVKRWKIRVSGGQDITVAFLEKDEGFELEDCHILFIPNAFCNQKETVDIYEGSAFFKEFKVEFSELKDFLKEYVQATKQIKEEK